MTTISAKVVEDSLSPDGIRLTTMVLCYPRFIHAEMMTHRVFARNASSFRAIPVERLIQNVVDDPVIPLFWGKNQKGMQSSEELDDAYREEAKQHWFDALHNATETAFSLAKLNAHKQLVNRILEPFSHINVILSSTQWDNFFMLRDHEDAEPHIQLLARRMKDEMYNSIPKPLDYGQYHLPLVPDGMVFNSGREMAEYSAANCARVSYNTHEGNTPSIEKNRELFHRLITSEPPHASPTEHQAMPHLAGPTGHSGPFLGWMQFRKVLGV